MTSVGNVVNVAQLYCLYSKFLIVISAVVARLYVFGGYGSNIEDYLHGIGEFCWDAVS